MARPAPAYTRLDVEERRRRLLELGADLFTRHSYEELSMAAIAREAGISKALLYHYFPSKQAYFAATLRQAAAEVEALVAPDADLPAADQLAASLDAFLGWIEANPVAYAKLMQSVAAVPEVREVVDTVRSDTAATILTGLSAQGDPPPGLRAAVRGWLWFMDGVCLDWLENGDLDRDQVRALLIGTLLGAIAATGHGETAARLA